MTVEWTMINEYVWIRNGISRQYVWTYGQGVMDFDEWTIHTPRRTDNELCIMYNNEYACVDSRTMSNGFWLMSNPYAQTYWQRIMYYV